MKQTHTPTISNMASRLLISARIDLIVFSAAFLIGLLWIGYKPEQPPLAQWSDSKTLLIYSRNMNTGQGFQGPVPFNSENSISPSASVSPGYPVFLLLVDWLSKLSLRLEDPNDTEPISPNVTMPDDSFFTSLYLTQCLLHALCAVCVYRIAIRVFPSRSVATLAGLLAATHYYWIISITQIADGLLVSFFLTGSVALAIKIVSRPSGFGICILGLFLGAVSLTRASLLLFTLCTIYTVYRLSVESRKRTWILLLLGSTFLTHAPWLYRNLLLFHSGIPVSTRWGLDIWWGNNSESTGGLAPRIINTQFPVVDIQTGVSKLIHPYSVRGRRLRELSEPERFHSLLRESAGLFDGWIWNHPDHFLMLRIKAFVYFFTGQMFWLENNLHDVPDARFEPDRQSEIIIELPSLNFPDSPDETKIRLSDTIVQDDTGSIISETKTIPGILPPWDPLTPWILVFFGVTSLSGLCWSHCLQEHRRLILVTIVSVLLPAVFSYSGLLHESRLPLDGCFLIYSAFALKTCISQFRIRPFVQNTPTRSS